MMREALPPGGTIGILGGGQLGRMLATAAARLGYRTVVLTPERDAPASHVACATIEASYDDREALDALAARADRITVEFENIPAETIEHLARSSVVRPGPWVVATAQDRIREKRFFEEMGIRTAPWRPALTADEAERAADALGGDVILKTARLGYDGRGQARLRDPSEAKGAFERLGSVPLIVEARVAFACEASVVVARGQDGTLAAFDMVENRHRDGILELTLAPSKLPDFIQGRAQAAARTAAERIDLVGLLALELFVTDEGDVLANEMAPRPHNSGHWTMEACRASQFEQAIRAVAGLPLASPFRHADAAMRNLIGDEVAAWPRLLADREIIPHLYGKGPPRPGRKMGHATRLWRRGRLPDEATVRACFPV